MRRRQLALAAVLALAVVAVALVLADGDDPRLSSAPGAEPGGEGSASTTPAEPPPVERVRRLSIGAGSRAVVVLRPEPTLPRPPAVLFLHGWGLTSPDAYGPWLRHLARAGNVVIYPRYQLDSRSDPALARSDAVAGLRAALRRVPVDRGALVVAGHSAGGALAADYAAVSRQSGLPVPVGVLAVYPGRAILGYPAGIPPADLGRIAPSTHLVAMAGAGDTVVGRAPALGIHRDASRIPRSRRRYLLVKRPEVADHDGPTRSTRGARLAFWRPLDRLIARARG